MCDRLNELSLGNLPIQRYKSLANGLIAVTRSDQRRRAVERSVPGWITRPCDAIPRLPRDNPPLQSQGCKWELRNHVWTIGQPVPPVGRLRTLWAEVTVQRTRARFEWWIKTSETKARNFLYIHTFVMEPSWPTATASPGHLHGFYLSSTETRFLHPSSFEK